ncbi:MAG: hypothetical protein JOZ96_04115 [Acidobacteria bacterium]|nr:hypothetical protein [Acidobacteriota bacterium]
MLLQPSRVARALLAALCLALWPAAPAAAQNAQAATAARGLRADLRDAAGAPKSPKRLVLLRAGGGVEGSRVTISSDSPLDDCDSYVAGESFYVRIPWAVAADARGAGAPGRFYKSARVEEQGDAVLVTFALREGAAVSLVRGFNRIEVTFADGRATPQPTPPAPGGEEAATIREMREQIAALEARVRELEARSAAPTPNAPAAALAETAKAETTKVGADAAPASTDAAAHAAHGAGAQHGEHDAEAAGAPRLQIQGFADVNLRAGNAGGQHTSFALGQLDLFLTSRLSEKFDVLSELIIEANERNQFTFEIHRLLLQYTPNDNLHLGLGRYHTAIGFFNTAYHHGTWFQTTADRPFIFSFEGKGGILPLHNVGLQATGRVPGAPWGMRYVAEVGNGRASRTPLDSPVQTASDENNRKAFNLGLYVRPNSARGLQAGFSVYRDRLTPLGKPGIDQTIGAGHLVFQDGRYESLNEFVLMRLSSGGRVYNTPAFYTQFARQFGNLRPFFRYQYVNVPGDNPLYADVGRRNGPALGIRYDLTDFAAFKAQYEHTSRRRQSALDELILQLAFTF